MVAPLKFLKAFAAARGPFRLIAIFDNDTVGQQHLRQVQALKLPHNVIVLALPDIELARAYPTVGPGGPQLLDVNGKAASIELYLGRSALSNNGQLRPVRWTAYVDAAASHQGEVQSKADIQSAFFDRIKTLSDPADARTTFLELAEVWRSIFKAVEAVAAKGQSHFADRFPVSDY
jgi:hypothetical protein